MAIDTVTKRRSVVEIFPVPDGTIDSSDRRVPADIYWGWAIAPSGLAEYLMSNIYRIDDGG